jgi:alpha-L-rhamnosidase
MRYSNNGGELYDARYYLPGWNRIDFDDSKWSGARYVDMRTELCAHAVEPTRIIDTVLPVGIAGSNPYKFDMGRNYTGWVQLNMSGLSAGDTIYIKVADDAESGQDCGQLNRYISNGAEKESFCNRFNYIAGRYITVEGLKRKPELSDITGYAIGTDLKQTGSFSCSNELFNRIYATDLWTFRVNTTEGYTSDCPHRERMGYGEETFATAWGIGLPNYESGAYYNKVVRDWTDVQESNGWFHHTAPQVNKHFGGVMWSSAGLNVSWEHYLQFGDRKILETIYPAAVRWLDFLHRNTKADGLLACYGEHWGFFLGDWAAPGQRSEGGDSPQAIYFNNCTYAMNLETDIEIAKVLGHSAAAALYAGRLEALKAHIHKAFFKTDSCIYSDGNQVQLAFALITGITPEDKIQAVKAHLANALAKPNAYFDMGSSGLPVLLRYLTQHPGTGKLAAAILAKTTEPGYGYFLRRGETTWPEYWNIDVQSRMHTCYTGIAGWLTKSLCGIHPDSQSPGFRRFVIQPVIVPEVSFAESAVESPYGRIESRWERQGGRTELSVTVPPNSVATVYIPARSADRITESGVNIGKSEEITLQGTAGGYVMVEVGAGKYKFQSK